MTLTDEQRRAQPLLESFGTILVPPEVDDAFFSEMLWSLWLGRTIHPVKPLLLIVNGNGGDSFPGMGVCDLIERDGNTIGIALGSATSTHTLIFAACQTRFIGPRAILGFHQASYSDIDGHIDADEIDNLREGLRITDREMVRMLAAASDQPSTFWDSLINRGRRALVYLTASMVIGTGLARPLAEFQPLGHALSVLPSGKTENAVMKGIVSPHDR